MAGTLSQTEAELLERAARAAGLRLYAPGYAYLSDGSWWRPLDDLGHAMKLALHFRDIDINTIVAQAWNKGASEYMRRLYVCRGIVEAVAAKAEPPARES